MDPLSTAPPPPEEDDSLEAVLPRMRGRLKHVLALFHVPAQDAEDVLQEAFLVAARKWDEVRNKEAWLIGTLRYKCFLYWKRQNNGRMEPYDLADLERLCEPIPPVQERAERRIDLGTLTQDLSSHHRKALWLRFGYGLTHEEIASRLGYCASSIRKMTGRSLARIKKGMAGFDQRVE
jgi:RNA polymerase sigma factor (sigma-70 family)